uniref:Uncharacterized protein n=1 Tax=virus sp. ctE0n6 TaxID=2827985 RepID=A0A8S5RG15_9VIRU|nr:MAG TPA: hypothetical protein [virus sp. ctE0n6]
MLRCRKLLGRLYSISSFTTYALRVTYLLKQAFHSD